MLVRSLVIVLLFITRSLGGVIHMAGGENYYSNTNSTAAISLFTPSVYVNNATLACGSTAPGRTYIHVETKALLLIQPSWLTSFEVYVINWASTNEIKLKIFRKNGATYDHVYTSEAFSGLTPNATNTLVLASPTLVREGDIWGVYLSYNTSATAAQVSAKSLAGCTNYYETGDITSAGWSPSLHVDNFRMNMRVFGTPANVGYTGDSIMAGHNAGADWRPYLDNIVAGIGPVGGTPSSAIPFVCQQTNGLNALFVNASKGSQTFAWVASTGGPAITNEQANVMVVHCGVNDVNTARSWTDVAADLDSVRTMHARPKPLFVSEILPWTAGSDAQAATIRTWNTNLAGWCTTNAATLLPMHDALGQLRISTGYLDDLLAAYDQDGVHLTQAGVNAYSTRLYQALRRVTE